MSSLKDLILKRAEFDTDKTENESAHFRLDHPTMPAAQMFFEGVYWKHKKLRPLIVALVEVVEAASCNNGYYTHPVGCLNRKYVGCGECELCAAFADLRKLLEEK